MRTRLLLIGPLISQLRKLQGFTIVEVTSVVCAVVILSAIAIIRIGDVRSAALDAQAKADAVQLQQAYDRAVNYQLDILTNDSIPIFATNAYDQALITQIPSPDSLAKIFLAPNSHITNDTAAFITQTNASDQTIPPPAVTMTSPTSGQTFLAGQAILLSAAVSSLEYISQVVFLDNGTTVGAAAASPYNLTITTTAGSHTFAAVATAASGQTGNSQVTVTVNPNAPPLVYLNQPPAGSYPYSTPLTLQAVASDPNVGGGITKLSIFAGSNQIATTTSSTYSGIWYGSPGNYSFVAKAWDVANAMTASTPVAVTLLPNNPPTITLNSPTAGQSFMSPTTVPLRVTAVADGGPVVQVKYVISGGPTLTFTSFPFSYDWVNPVAGDYSVQAFAYDNTGAQGQSASNSITVTQDNPPTVSLESPTNGSSLLSPITISVTATATSSDSTITNVNLLINGNMVSSLTSPPYTYSWVNPYSGTYTICAIATDDHGVTANSPTNSVSIAQDQPPSIVLTNPTNGATYLTPVTVQLAATATDPDDGVAYVDFIVDGQTIATVTQSPYTFNWVNPISGSHTIQAVAYDYHTLSTASSTISVLVNQDPPPGVALSSPSTETVLTPTNIALSATASVSEFNVGGSIAGVGFYTNGVLYTNIASTPYNSTLYLPLTGAGIYTIQAVAMDNLGVTNGSLISTVTAVQDQPPSSVVLTSPTNGQPVLTPATVVLSATASDPDDGVARVDFVDGNNVIISLTSTPYNFNWPNPASGTHNLTAVAYDTKGLSLTSAVVSITVTADVAPTIALTSPSDGDIFLNPTNVVMSATAFSSLSGISKVQFIVDNSTFATVYSTPYTSSWTNPSYGAHVIYAIAYDNLGLSTSTPTVTIQAGTNHPPTIAWVTPTNGFSSIVPTNLTLQVTATDPQNEVILVTITDQYGDRLFTSTSATGPYSTAWTAGIGTYNLTATVYDQHGASDSATIQVTGIQSQAPSVALSAPTSGAVYVAPASVTITASANDTQTGNGVSMVELYANGTLIASTNSDTITTNWSTGEGSYAITAKAYDNFTASQVSAPVSITVQGPVAPVVILNSPANGTTFTNLDGGGASVSMGVTITDSNSGFLVSKIDFYDGSTQLTETTGATSFTDTTLANGSHSLWARVTDSYSQVGYSQTNSITIQAVASGNLEAPAVTISSSVASGTIVPTGTPITFTATAVNNGNGGSIADVQIMVNGSSAATLTSAPYTYTWMPVSAATNTIEAVAYTALNVPGASTNISIISFVNQVPTVALVAPVANQTFLGPTTVTFQATASGFYGTIQQVDFTANGSVVGSATTATGGYYTFAWANCTVGSYPVYATAYDVYGAHTNTTPITINVSQLQPPTSVAITSPSSGANLPTPYNVVINATAVDDADGIASVTILTNGVPLTTLTVSPYSYTWVNPPAAGYNLTAIAQNNGGLTLTSAVVNFTISTATAPTVAWTSPSPTSGTYRYNYPFTWEVTPSDQFTPQSALNVAFYDNSNYVATVSQGNSWTMTGYIPTAGATHYMTAWTTNESGIAGSSSTLTIVMETNNPPAIVLNSPTNGATEALNSSVTLQATASDPDLDPVIVVFYVDGTPIITNTTPSGSVFTSSTAFGIGSHTVSAMALSYGFSNPGVPSATNNIHCVHQAPQIALNSPTNGSSFTLNSAVSLSFSAQPQDGTSIASVSQSVDGTSYGSSTTQNGLTNSTSTLTSGSHAYTAIATDSTGTSTTNSTSFMVNHTAPLVTINLPANGSSFIANSVVSNSFAAQAYDGTSITNIKYYLDASPVGSSNNVNGITNSTVMGQSSVGTHTYMVVATDSSGATGSTNITFTIITYTGPTVTVTQPTNNSLFAPGSYTITANAVDQMGLNLTALALYMDGSMVATNAAGSTSNSISLTTNFNAGTHSIYAVAADLSGSTKSATNTVTVAVLTQPTVYFTNYNGYAINSSIYQDGMALIAVASSPLRAITNVQFFDNGTSLGNGTTAAFAITNWYAANWQNASVGSHTITAVAKDTLGIANTNTLTVTASPGFNNVTGALISMQSGTYWSYWTCPSRSSTPYSSKVADVFQYSSWNYWIYGNPSGGTFPEITQGGQNENPGASGSGSGEGDALIAFTAPSAGNLDICGTTAITQAGSAGVLFRIWNGSTIIYPASGSGWATNFEGQNLLVNATASVSAGSMIQFQFAGNDTTGNYDSFSLPVTLSYTSGTNSYPASQPTVTVTTPPSGVTNLPVGRATNITITASDSNSGGLIEGITVAVDGTTLASPVYNTGITGSFSGSTAVSWTPSSAGNHTLTAIAYDNYGQSNTNSVSATAVVFNPPRIVLTPATETVASGSYTITGTATDKMGTNITAMALYLDSSQVATSSSSPITYTAGLSAGTHYIYASAADWYGTTNSATNTLTVQTPPTVYFTNYNGQPLCTSIYQDGTPLIAVASGAGGHTISSVNFYDNGNLLGGGSTNAFGGYSGSANWYAYNWQNASVGSQTLTAVATDSAGLTNTATLSVTASPGFNNKYGAPVNSQNGTYWSYWTCQSAGSTSTKVALYWEDEPGSPGNWGYGTTASWGIPWMSVGPFCNPGVSGTPSMPDSSGVGDALLGFNCPSTGNVNINGDVQLANASSVGIRWRILNGTAQLYPASGWITNSANQTIDVNYSTSVTAGNTLFVQTSCVNNNDGSDWVYYPMTITYTSGTNSYNNPPSVSLTAPAGNTNIALGTPATLTATATSQNPGGTITSVVFLNGSTVIDSNTTPTGSTYTYNWSGIPAGTNTVTAKAYDSYGYTAQTAGETVTATLYPPTVSISSPANGSYVEFGTATTITATASSQDPGVSITNVAIVVNGTTITNIAASPYSLTWTAGIASNNVQGIATDSNGLKNTNSIYITSDIKSGLVDYYLFDPDFAGNSDDTGSGGLGGLRTLYPMPTTNIYVTPGQGTSPTNHCVALNGTSQYEWTGANDSIPFGTGSFTIDIWFKTTDTSASTHRMFGQSIVNGTLWLSLYQGKPTFIALDSTGVYWANSVSTSSSYADGNWHNFTCVINQGNKSYQCYIDGTLFSSAAGISTSGSFSGNASTYLGVDVSMIYYFSGSLDSLRIYNTALTQTQVQAIDQYFSTK